MRFYYGWVIVGVALVTMALAWGVGLFSFALWAEPLAKSFGASRGEVMGANMMVNFGAGILSPLVGFAMEKRSIRLLMFAGVILLAAGLVLVAMASAIWQIWILYGLVIAGGLTLTGPIAAQTLAVKWFRRRRGLAIGIVSVGGPLGGVAVPPVAGYLIDHYGWQNAYLLLTGLFVVVLLPLIGFLIHSTPEDKGVAVEPADTATAHSAERDDKVWTTAEIVRDRTFWASIFLFVSILLVFNGYFFNVGLIVADLGGTTNQAALVVSLGSLMAIVGTLASGVAADRFEHRSLLTAIVLVIAAGLGILAMGVGYAVLLATIMVMGIFVAATLPLVSAVLASRFGAASFSRAFGLVSPSITLAGVGGFLAGSVRDAFGSYDVAFMALLVALLPAVIGVVLLKAKATPAIQAAPS